MKPAEMKREYVRLRAEGNSYSAICEQLHISKSTCTKWEQELAAEIGELKRAELEELYESYHMTKEARIRRLGDTLESINTALGRANLAEVDPAKLLDHQLKYMDALKGEYIGTAPALEPDNITAEAILSALGDLLNRARAGDLPAEQAHKEGGILAQLLKAYDITEIKTKLDKLEAIISERTGNQWPT